MKQIFVMFALLLGVCAANAQTPDTVKYAAGNDLYRGITRKLPYRQMVTPYGVEVTFAKTVHIIFPAAVRYVDLGSNHIIAGKADGAENVIRVKATTEGFPGETNFSVICEDGSFFSFNAKYAREPEMLNIEMKDFLENEDTSDFSHTRMNIHFRELGNESPLLVKLIMRSIYKNNDRKVRHLGSKRFGIQFLIKGIYTYNGMLYVHTQTKNSSNVPFDTDFIKFKIVDKKVPKRTAIQETVLDAVRSYNEVIEIAGKSTVRTVYALPKFTIPDDKLLLVELYEKNGGRHQVIRVENADIVAALVLVTACNDNLDIQQAYPFSIETLPVPQRLKVGETAEIRCQLVRGGYYQPTTYQIRYFQPDGKGKLEMDNGTVFLPNDLYPLEKETFRLYYTSASTDQQTIDIYVIDSFGQVQQLSFSFNGDNNNERE